MSLAAPPLRWRTSDPPSVALRTVGYWDRLARESLARVFRQLGGGALRLVDGDGTHLFGSANSVPASTTADRSGTVGMAMAPQTFGNENKDDLKAGAESPEGVLSATVVVENPAFYRHAVLGGNLSIAESYLNGDWHCSDLTALFRLFTRNVELSDAMDSGFRRLMQWPALLYHRLHANSRSGSRKNIHLHYDLGNDFFALMLDETMAYSSGIYPDAGSGLRDASIEKMDRLCRKLELRSSDHLLEIGTGWGGLAIHAARHYGCRVTTTTVSQEQREEAVRRIEREGLAERIQVQLTDYRDLTGRYDKIVSVEMVEAVGHEFLSGYFRQLGRLLKPHGSVAIQGIVMGEQRHAQYLRNVDFIQRYVFPGGCLPSVGSLVQAASRGSDLRFVHLEDFAEHYARTLADWRERFLRQLPAVRQLGYPDRFLRLWNYYLCYCEAGFAERYLSVVHLQFDKPDCARDPLQITQQAANRGNWDAR
ncbi:MAG: class I SAM-dependent methyltransferase [Planctomycetota bacterium]